MAVWLLSLTSRTHLFQLVKKSSLQLSVQADKAGNLLTPNPATVSIQKGDKDGVAPTVSSVVQSGAKTFEITFSEALSSKPAVSLDGVIVSAANVSIDSKDAKKVTVDAGAVLTGDKVVTISGAVDGSGEVQAATNRVVKSLVILLHLKLFLLL